MTLVHGWPDDAERWIDSVLEHEAEEDVEILVVVNTADEDVRGRLQARAGGDVRMLFLEPTGWAEAANAGIAEARGECVVLFDPGTELGGEVIGALAGALADSTVAVAGPFGVRGRGTWKEFDAHAGPEVDAIEGYCLAFRRADALAAGGFDRRYRFYRMADFELSLRLRAEGGRRALVVPVPVARHAHRLWDAEPEAERDRLSRRNLYRLLDRWRDREDLLVSDSR